MSFRRHSSQPISWHSSEEHKPNATRATPEQNGLG